MYLLYRATSFSGNFPLRRPRKAKLGPASPAQGPLVFVYVFEEGIAAVLISSRYTSAVSRVSKCKEEDSDSESHIYVV